MPDGIVDLVSVAQAAHWLDLDRFYAEAKRVARPHGVIALVTYGVLHVDGGVDALVQAFYHDVVGRYWPPERRHVEAGYRTLPFPFDEMPAPPLVIEVSWRLSDLAGYVETWSAVREAEKAMGRAPIEEFQSALASAWGHQDVRRLVRWPLSVRVGRAVSR